MNDVNWQYFNLEMYNDVTDTSANMEYLFDLVDPVTGGDPPQTSLFNLTTLKYLVEAGQNTPNIIANPELVYIQDFTLGQEWVNIAAMLQLYDPADPAGTVGTRRAYNLWLWMSSAWNMTFTREPEGGSYQIGVIGTLGATAFEETMNIMSLEVPMLTIATQLEIDYNDSGYNCHDFYYNRL